MRNTEVMPRSMIPLAAAAMLLLAACGEKPKSTDAPSDVAAAIADTAARPAMADSVASVEVIPPAPIAAQEAPSSPVAAPRKGATRPKPAPARGAATAPAKAPVASAPAPAPAAPERASGSIAAGTSIQVTNGAKVCSNTLQVGDRVTATTSSVVSGSNGVSIPSGSRVGLVVTKSKTSNNQTDEAELAFDVRSVTFGGETYTMTGEVSTEAVVKERKGGDGKKVAIGAAAGAVIGNVIGGGSRAQRTVVGAAAGGLAGAAAAAMTGDRFACLPEGAALTVRVGSALSVRN
jgi:hypothetical protein